MILKCEICGKDMEAQKTTKKYCSKECMNIARRTRTSSSINIERTCPLCGKSFKPKTAAANHRVCCYECMPEGTQLTRGMFLAKIKQKRGGACIRCGYNTCIKALEFHHMDPSEKDFTISNDHFKLQEAIDESEKCILICSNCHRELHDDMWSIEDLKK
jgi:endogenous inhibitor of DNA gyrase (YacG/DUF329 family)